jgi:hypothetical protein
MIVLLTSGKSPTTIVAMSKNSSVSSVNPGGMPAVFPQGSRTESTLPHTQTTDSSELDLSTKDFKDLLMVLMLSSVLSGMNSSGGGMLGQTNNNGGLGALGAMGSSSGSMLSPAIMSLLNNILQPEGTSVKSALNKYANPDEPHLKPTSSGHLTQEFSKDHIGVDTGISVGTPIHATMNGKVTYAGWNNEGYGNLVIVQNGKYTTYFAHLSEVPVEVGQSVTSGNVIGYSGNTGNSTGPHLHYEVRIDNVAVDPMKFYGNKVDQDA